jgi:phosphopantetheinyl transferase
MPVKNSNMLFNLTDLSWPGIEHLHSACLGMVILDLEILSPAEDLFTPREWEKSIRMKQRRLKSFTGSREALKLLSRQLGLVEENRPNRTIETMGPDNQKPCLAESPLYCSVSHSSQYVVAVAHRYPIGVDIEAISNRILRIESLFLSPGEKHLIAHCGMEFLPAATRVWTMKEAAAKAFGLNLFQALRQVEVITLGKETGVFNWKGSTYSALYCAGEEQVMALVTNENLTKQI